MKQLDSLSQKNAYISTKLSRDTPRWTSQGFLSHAAWSKEPDGCSLFDRQRKTLSYIRKQIPDPSRAALVSLLTAFHLSGDYLPPVVAEGARDRNWGLLHATASSATVWTPFISQWLYGRHTTECISPFKINHKILSHNKSAMFEQTSIHVW